jgi:hypothetical protein
MSRLSARPFPRLCALGLAVALPSLAHADEPHFEIHEWGVVEFADEVRFGSIPAPARPSTAPTDASPAPVAPSPPVVTPPRPRPVARKPLIYVLTTATESFALRVDVAFSAGRMLETWPRVVTPLASDSAPFEVRVHPTACDATSLPSALTAASLGCETLPEDAFCEAAELHEYHTTATTCLEHDGQGFPLLLYNGPVQLEPPVMMHRGDEHGALTVHNTSPDPLIGVIVRQGRQFWVVGALAAGEAWSSHERVPDLHAGVHDGHINDLVRSHLAGLGMAAHAIDDFAGAWLTPGYRQSGWDVWGFYSTEAYDRIAPLTATPAPARVVRALAFSVRLNPMPELGED